MIFWLTGNSGSGKSTLAKHLKTKDAIILDGDEMRQSISENTGFSKSDRWTHNIRVAKLSRILENQGFVVIVSLICPYEKLREEVRKITDCKFIYLQGGKTDEDYPYEIPETSDVTLEKWNFDQEYRI